MLERTFGECLEFVRQAPKEAILTLKDFVKVTPETVLGWVYDLGKPPSGDIWIRCVGFFRLQGWRVSEFDDSDPLRVLIVEALAYRVVSHAELLKEASYKVKVGNSPLHTFVYGNRKLVGASRILLERFLQSKAKEIAQARINFGESHRIVEPDKQQSSRTDTQLSFFDRIKLILNEARIEDVERIAVLLRLAAPYIYALRDDDSRQGALQREKLRQLVGLENYSLLSVALNVMRSRRSYENAQRGEVN